MVADLPFCAYAAYRYQDKGLSAGKSPLTFEPLGIAMAEDSLLINWVRNFLNTLQGTGQLKKLHAKWLEDGGWISELP
jgi:ABC-type amino acid transport substrate-binding protein